MSDLIDMRMADPVTRGPSVYSTPQTQGKFIMQTARCHQDGAIYNAPSFGNLNPDEIEQKRGLLSCPECDRHSYFRRQTRNGRAPCFCAHHEPGCEFAASSPMARSDPFGLGRFSSGVLDRPIVVDFAYGSWDGGVQCTGRQPANSSAAANPSGQIP